MAKRTLLIQSILLCSMLMMIPIPAKAQQNCSSFAFSNGVGPFATCITLPVLNSFLHWTYHSSNHTVDIAYRHTGVSASNWVAWALNPDGSGMLRAQCLVAFQNSSGLVHAYTAPIGTGTYFIQLTEGSLSFPVPRLSAEFDNNNKEMIIFATLRLPAGRTSFNQVWQVGPLSGDSPQAHDTTGNSPNTRSTGTVDFATGQVSAGGGVSNSRMRKRNVHGVLNAVSWGILMPVGAVIARYLKVFKSATPAWFYLHVTCQTSAYIVGVAGWGTGLKLGSDSKGITYDTHRNIGIALFCLGTLQVFALLLRPKPDHKYRLYWNIYHWATGYVVIALSIVNIFKGFDILDPQKKWKNAYTGVIIAIGGVAVALEAITWLIVLKRKKDGGSLSDNNKYPPHSSNRVNGVNGYGA
ncbi:OLC1v1024870C1 [Oldenlandia corymbosa var. corymbosa]|uniref:Cytochrome b561 and DOMON domain-containing protein n=1 Tax=Oldenlandia corymbosa var. corymbosa TaxID=529605 RepID=A0AAV1C3E0_OLDCO|nr:OLC1v1024870C1 [Oldenlandia corymbosa var. corymbosa]